jgi:hypothetical protein
VRDVLTEHEALPSEVFVQFRVADHFVELDGVWQFGNVESRQVGHPMVPGISRPQRRSIKVTRRNESCGLACDVVLIDKVEDIVYGCSSCRLRLGRFHRLWNVTRAWVASWRPMGWACVNALNHVGQFNLRMWSVFANACRIEDGMPIRQDEFVALYVFCEPLLGGKDQAIPWYSSSVLLA